MKYRVRLSNGRVIGPLEIKDFVQLYNENKITGNEDAQVYPTGDWKPLSYFTEINLEKTINEDKTFMKNLDLTEINLNSDESNIETTNVDNIQSQDNLKEFSFELDPKVQEEINKEIEDKVIEAEKEKKAQALKREKEQKAKLEKAKEEKTPDVEEDDDKTVVRKLPVTNKSEVDDKTQINPEYQEYLRMMKKEAEEKARLEQEKKAKEVEIIEVDYANESTQMISATELRKNLKDALDQDEKLKKEQEDIKKEKEKIKRKKAQAQTIEDIDEEEDGVKSKKNFFIILLALFVFVFFFLDDPPEDNKKKLLPIKTIEPNISFPIRYETPDINKAKEFYAKGLQVSQSQAYNKNVEAVKYFLEAAQFDFNNIKIISKLIFTYSEILKNSQNLTTDANTIFKLSQIFYTRALTSHELTSAIANFYIEVGKINAALNILDKYENIPNNRPSVQLFAVSLRAFSKAGLLDTAVKRAQRLEEQTNKDLFTYKSLFEYYSSLNDLKQMDITITKALKKYPNSVYFLSQLAQRYFTTQQFKEIKPVIFKINELQAEQSRIFKAEYLMIYGLYLSSQNNLKLGTQKLDESLKLKESTQLIELLSQLSEAEDLDVNDLINYGKAKKQLNLAKADFKKGNIKSAFSQTIKAGSIYPNLIDTKLFLAKLQLERGYFKDAISQLEKLHEDNATSLIVLELLIESYIRAYKFRQASEKINFMATLLKSESDIFYNLRSLFYEYKKDFNLAAFWLIKAINQNPLNEKNIYKLAKVYLKHKKFEKAKTTLKRVIELDPLNIDYRLSYAEIIYEYETAEAAIGYLYDILKDFPDNVKVLSKIGIYYYRSGQIKNFQNIKKQISEVPGKDPSLYKFMIETARLDDNIDGVIENTKKYLEQKPGDLKERMNLVEIFFNQKKWQEAGKQLNIIEERLDTYPLLKYYRAKVAFKLGKTDLARKLATEEMLENPTLVEAYNLLGEIAFSEKEMTLARKHFMKGTQVNPRSIDAIVGIAKVAYATDQYDMALDQYQKAINLKVDDCLLYLNIGNVYRRISQSQLAIKNYQNALNICPNLPDKNKIQTYIRTMR